MQGFWGITTRNLQHQSRNGVSRIGMSSTLLVIQTKNPSEAEVSYWEPFTSKKARHSSSCQNKNTHHKMVCLFSLPFAGFLKNWLCPAKFVETTEQPATQKPSWKCWCSQVLTFHLPNRTEVLFESIIKFGICDGFKITCVNSSSRGGKTTFTHTGVISQSPFIKIWMS